MKLAIGIAVSLWLLCGLAGAWMLDDLSIHRWKTVARGGLTLAEALKEHPVSYPGPS